MVVQATFHEMNKITPRSERRSALRKDLTEPTLLEMSGYGGGLNGSMQHQFEVHLAEFERLNSLTGLDSKKTPSLLGLIECSPEDQFFLKSTIGSTD